MGAPTLHLLTLVDQAEAQSGLPPGILAGLLAHESAWNVHAENINGPGSVDRGIAQINSKAHPAVTDAEAYDPAYAIPRAARYLRAQIDRCGSLVGGLEAYNSGQCHGDSGYARAVIDQAGRYGFGGLAPLGVAAVPRRSIPWLLVILALLGAALYG